MNEDVGDEEDEDEPSWLEVLDLSGRNDVVEYFIADMHRICLHQGDDLRCFIANELQCSRILGG